MVIGVPKEVRKQEYRVSVTPSGVRELVLEGQRVLVERSAGEGSGFTEAEYAAAGAETAGRERVFGEAELIVKVKEPLPEEYGLLREGQALFTFLHLAPNRELTDLLLEKKITAFGYETLQDGGALPLLAPMSEIAGRMSPIMASYYLQRPAGGSGVLPSGAPGVMPANALVLGGGTVGRNASRVALALGMRVTVLNRGMEKLRKLDQIFNGRISTMPSLRYTIEEQLSRADVVIGAVLVMGARSPVLVTGEMVSNMKKGSVIVDVSVDQGGCMETTRPTTHDAPVYMVDGVVHYAVANMPGAYPRTSTLALTNGTLAYVRKLASLGAERALREDLPLRTALNTHAGMVAHKGLSESTGLPYGEVP